MRVPRTVGLLLGLGIMAGPWVWAMLAVKADPSMADAQGAYSLATYASVILVPLGLIVVISSLRK